MIRRILLVLGLMLVLVTPSVPAQTVRQHHAAVQTQDCVVYVTRTGHRYHRAGCQYLRKSAIKMSRREAIKDGYSPCKRCGGSECE